MKKILKLLSFILVVIMVINSSSVVTASSVCTANSKNIDLIEDSGISKDKNDSLLQRNLSIGTKQYQLLKDNDCLNIMVYDNDDPNLEFWENIPANTSSNLKKIEDIIKSSDLNDQQVIFKKVKYSTDYLDEIQDFLTPYMEEYNIYVIGSRDRYNQVKIGVADLKVKDSIIKLLKDNIENFEEDVVRFEISEEFTNA